MNLLELGTVVDRYHEARGARLSAENLAANLKREENTLKEQIIRVLMESKTTSFGGKKATVKLQEKTKPQVQNWELLYDHIYATHGFDLLQRRLTETAVKARWDDKVEIPGVIAYPIFDLSVSK
jgi:hypothetical protein